MRSDELANGAAPPSSQQSRWPETEAPQQTAHAVIEIAYPPDQGIAGPEKDAPLAGGSGLHVHRPEPAHPQEMGNAAGVPAIGLHE